PLLAVAHARLDQSKDAFAFLGELGRTGATPAREFRGFRPRRLRAEMAGGARNRALDPFLYELRGRPAETVLRPLPQGRGHRMGQAAEGILAGAPPRREIRCAERERVAARAHQVDEVLSSAGRHDAFGDAAKGVKLC